MKQDTLEGKAKTKNGVKRLCFSIICIPSGSDFYYYYRNTLE